MANIDNECKDLEVKDFYKDSSTHLEDIMKHQKEMQEKTYGINFDEMSISEIKNFWLVNMHSTIDELHEMMDAVGGMHDGVGNAAWKPWKSANAEFRKKKLSDLSEGDLKELKMEWIDTMHFVFNAGLALGVTPKEFYNYYLSKNEENHSRQKRGY